MDDPSIIFITYKSKPMFNAELKHMQSCYRGRDDLCFIVFTESSMLNKETAGMEPIIRLMFLQSVHVPECLGEIIAVIRVPNLEDGQSIRSYYKKKLFSHAIDPEDPDDTPYSVSNMEISKMLDGVRIVNIKSE